MPIDKKLCLEIIDRAIRVYPNPADFRGQAKNFKKFTNPDFLEFAKKHDIQPETIIEVRETKPDVFSICKA